jgi:hypothetical protein
MGTKHAQISISPVITRKTSKESVHTNTASGGAIIKTKTQEARFVAEDGERLTGTLATSLEHWQFGELKYYSFTSGIDVASTNLSNKMMKSDSDGATSKNSLNEFLL